MAKPKPNHGAIVRPDGLRVPIRNGTIAQAIHERDERIQDLTMSVNSAQKQVNDTNLKLARLQNHWWTRFGEALRLVKVRS
jgi:hypothetical protein